MAPRLARRDLGPVRPRIRGSPWPIGAKRLAFYWFEAHVSRPCTGLG